MYDEQCRNGGVAFQPELHLEQTLLFLSPHIYKHPKTTILNLNTLWMKQNYKNIIKLIIIISYFLWIILNSWKSNIFMNYFVRFAILDSWFQFLISNAIFNFHAYTQWVDQIISYKSSSFSIRDVASFGMFFIPQALRPNTYNNYSKVNLTKVGFRNGEHCFTIVTSLSHLCCALAWAQLTAFWSFRMCRTMTFPKMQTFILAWSWCQGPFQKLKAS